jgi:hypothetical protein
MHVRLAENLTTSLVRHAIDAYAALEANTHAAQGSAKLAAD